MYIFTRFAMRTIGEDEMRQLNMLSVAFAVLFGASNVAAQSFVLTDFVYPIRPQPGAYYDQTQSGTGLTVDSVGLANGGEFVFSTYYHYGADGTPEWMNFGAPLVQQSMADYTASGVPAVIRGQWNYSQAGQCFDCAFTPNVVSTPPYGQRTFNVIGGRDIQMPASGNAAVRNMRLAKALKPGNVMSRALLESGAVWSVMKRSTSNGVVSVRKGGWIGFKKRTGTAAGERSVFSGFETPIPAFLDVANKNALDQYEAVCVRGLTSDEGVGFCDTSSLLDRLTDGFDSQSVTFLVDPSNDRIRVYERCVTPATGACPPTQPSVITRAGDVIDAGLNADGQPRLVIRLYAGASGGWFYEYELTRVGSELINWLYPNGLTF